MGMGRSLQVDLPIDEAYVPLKTQMTRSLEQRETSRFKEGHGEYEELVDLGEVFRKTAALKLRRDPVGRARLGQDDRLSNSRGVWPAGRVCRRIWDCLRA